MQGRKTLLLITFFVCEAICCFSQQGPGLKIYQNTDIYQIQTIYLNPREYIKKTTANCDRISLAFVLHSKKSYFHEVEFQFPENSKPIEKLDLPLNYTAVKGDKLEEAGSSFSLRYELGKCLVDKSKPINFLLSAGLNPYYVELEYTPTTSSSYYNSVTYYGVALNATPRLYVKLNRRFIIDLNVPIRIYNFQRAKYRQDNPILPAQQQRHSETNHLFLEAVYTLRLGLMYSLTPIKQ